MTTAELAWSEQQKRLHPTIAAKLHAGRCFPQPLAALAAASHADAPAPAISTGASIM